VALHCYQELLSLPRHPRHGATPNQAGSWACSTYMDSNPPAHVKNNIQAEEWKLQQWLFTSNEEDKNTALGLFQGFPWKSSAASRHKRLMKYCTGRNLLIPTILQTSPTYSCLPNKTMKVNFLASHHQQTAITSKRLQQPWLTSLHQQSITG